MDPTRMLTESLNSGPELENDLGQTFTFELPSERRLSSAEADQALTSYECH
jgi:hypothetical protein